MDRIHHGQRLLMALSHLSQETYSSPEISLANILMSLGGVVCLLVIIFLCACKDGNKKKDDLSLQERRQSHVRDSPVVEENEIRGKTPNDNGIVITNGGPKPSSTGHSRQASAGSVHMRPQSLRELPEPPVTNHARNASMSGQETSNLVKSNGHMNGPDYAYPQHVPHYKTGQSNRGSMGDPVGAGDSVENKVTSHSDGYDHLRPNISSRPTDYDTFADSSEADQETPLSETGSAGDGHYSQLKGVYEVVTEVGPKRKPFNNFSNTSYPGGVDHYSLVKDEDPYNSILESGGTVSQTLIRRIKSKDSDDPYSTCQDSGGEFKSLMEEIGAVGGVPLPSHPVPDYGDINDEYAMVDKSGRVHKGERLFHPSADDKDDNSIRPPEPPRLYTEEEDSFHLISSSGHRKEHKYSKVTARESLASLSERKVLNPYEIVSDIPENTYATVEGGSGDGVVLRNSTIVSNSEQRLSQSSDTYAEIGISGGGLSNSITSNSSSVVGSNTGAPIPPSLDSLHLMTKSQTSSEGDRYSDRHLATPEDTGVSHLDDYDLGDDLEDGYSTLKRTDGFSPHHANLGNSHLHDDPREASISLKFHRARDSISDRETDNDPNYESVEETKAKVAVLRARESNPPSSKNSKSKDSSKRGKNRMDHDYEEVDITPPSSPLTSQRVTVTSSYINSHSTSSSVSITTTTANSKTFTNESASGVQEDREQVLESHMYEELAEVRAKKSDMNKVKKGGGLAKLATEDRKKVGNHDKKKTSSGEKRKSEAEERKKDKNEEKRKSGSEEKKKEEKRKSDEKKKAHSDDKHNGTKL